MDNKSSTQEYLEQLGILDCQIKSANAEAQKLRSLADKTTTSFSFNKSHSGETNDRMADVVAKLIDLSEEVRCKIIDMIKLKRRISAQIERVQDQESRVLLRLRYVYCLTMEKVAADMFYSRQWIYILHDRAIQNFEKVIPEEERTVDRN